MKFETDNVAALVQVLDLAGYILHAKNQLDNIDPLLEVIQDLYRQVNAEGFDNLVSFNAEIGEYFTETPIETANNPIVLEEAEETFWDTLILKLSERDAELEVESGRIAAEDSQAQLNAEDTFAQKYAKHFEENGIAKLFVKPPS